MILASGLETHPNGTPNKNEIVNNNWELLDTITQGGPLAPPGVTTLTGGGPTALDGQDTSTWPLGAFVMTFADDVDGGTGQRYRVYRFRNIGADVEASPNFIEVDGDPTKIFMLIA